MELSLGSFIVLRALIVPMLSPLREVFCHAVLSFNVSEGCPRFELSTEELTVPEPMSDVTEAGILLSPTGCERVLGNTITVL